MFKIFNGTQRGPGTTESEIFIQLGVMFRSQLHHFKGAPLAVFMAIALHMDEDGVAFPSYDTLQRETGYGRGTIAKALDVLCELRIDDHPVLMRWRERDDEGKYAGSNRYKVFPTPDEIVQSTLFPTVEKSNGGKSVLEEEPTTKEEPINKDTAATADGEPTDELTALNAEAEHAEADKPADPPTPPKPESPKKPDFWGDFVVEVRDAFNQPMGIAVKIAEQLLGIAEKGERAEYNVEVPAKLGQVKSFMAWYGRECAECTPPRKAESVASWWHKYQQAGAPTAGNSQVRYANGMTRAELVAQLEAAP